MGENHLTEADINAQIEKLTTDAWTNRRPLLLSDLGMHLNKFGDYREVISPLKLRQYVVSKLSDKVKIVTHPSQPQKTGLIPAGQSFSFAAVTETNKALPPRSTLEKVKPSIWAAFVKPLAANAQRFLDIDDEALRFIDLQAGSAPPSASHKEVIRENIVVTGSEAYDSDQITKNIHKWAEIHDLSPEKIFIKEGKLKGRDSFFDMFKGLSESDLRRIEIPFDIIVKLAQK